jgi:hypothetical protein
MADYTTDLQAAIASYAPDKQIITFSPAMLILPRDGARGHFKTAVQMSYFFHEWIHYLHNVSTVHGMSAYSSFIGLWNAFRHTTDELGLGQGRFITSSAEELKTRAYLDVIQSTRRRADEPLLGEPSMGMCRIVSCKPAGNFNGIPDHLDVSVEVTNNLGDVVPYPKVIGPTEIIESVAYLLESHFLVRGFNHPPSSARVTAHLQPLVIQRADLAIKRTRTPILFSGFGHVPKTSSFTLNPQQCSVVSPTQFATHCVANWKGQIKTAHVTQIGGVKTFTELRGQSLCQCRQKSFAIRGTRLPILLKLDNMAADLPASLHLHHVDCA